MMATATDRAAIEYPSEDGQPMAETPLHVEAIYLLHQALQDFFRDRPDVFIAADIFWYWIEGDTSTCVAPDVLVAPGVTPKPIQERRTFCSWEEGTIPAVVFEMASRGTWQDDLEDKYELYEKLGVREYFLFDPEAQYLVPPLQGFRLRGGAYRRIRGADKTLESELGFRLRAEGEMLRLIDAATGQPVLTRAERADQERARADHERARAEEQTRRADQEQARADHERARAEEQTRRADGLHAEVERLMALLKQPGGANENGAKA